MWVVRKLTTIRGGIKTDVKSVQVYQLLNFAGIDSCLVSVEDTKTGLFREHNVSGYRDAVEFCNLFHPYGCVVGDGAVEMITFVVIDDLSLQFLGYVDKVAEVRMRDREDIVKKYWPKLTSGSLFDSFTALDKDKSLFHYSSLYKNLKGTCTLLHAVSHMDFGWYSSTFLLYMRRIRNMNTRFEGVELYQVHFNNLEQAKRLIGKMALVGNNMISTRG